ncbi:MAG: ATP-binding protein [Oligoflexales bacterium]
MMPIFKFVLTIFFFSSSLSFADNFERAGSSLVKGIKKEIGQSDFINEAGRSLESELSPRFEELRNGMNRELNQFKNEVFSAPGQIVWKSTPYIAGSVAILAGLYLTTRYTSHYITKAFESPRLETSKGDSWLIRNFKKNFLKIKPASYQDMALNPEVKIGIEKYLSAMKYSIQKKKQLPSMLLFGPPGTGKTEIAKRIAKEFNYDAVFLSGSSFKQFGGNSKTDGVSVLNQMFDSADKSTFLSRKKLIFIDEAESFLGKRSDNQSEEAEKLLTHFLSRTGSKSNNYSIIYATNRPNVLDKAMDRRIAFQVEVSLPLEDQRIELFKMYLGKVISDKDINTSEPLTEIFYRQLALHTKGFSGSDIEEVAYITQNQSYANGMNLSHDIVFDSVIMVMKRYNNKKDYVSKDEFLPTASET